MFNSYVKLPTSTWGRARLGLKIPMFTQIPNVNFGILRILNGTNPKNWVFSQSPNPWAKMVAIQTAEPKPIPGAPWRLMGG